MSRSKESYQNLEYLEKQRKSHLGKKHSEEAKRKMSEARKGKIGYWKDKKFSKESRKKMSLIRKGKKHSEETKKKIGLANSISLKRYFENGGIGSFKGKKHSEETRKKISILKIREKNPNWNNGSSFELYSVDWTKTLKQSIRERDKYICQLCSQYGNNVHHIDYDKKNCNPKNLITLCIFCHNKTRNNRDYWQSYFQQGGEE